MSIEKFLSNVVVDGTISKVGGTSSQFLKADGSIDSSTYSLSSHTHTFASLTSKPTTLAGYGITDAAPISGSGNYIQNQNTSAQSANMWINGLGKFGDHLEVISTVSTGYIVIDGVQTGHRKYVLENGITGISNSGFQIRDITGGFTPFYIDSTGAATFSNSVTSTGFLSNTVNTGTLGQVGSTTAIRLYDSGADKYGIGVNASSGGMEYMANQAAAGAVSHRFFGGTDNASPTLLATINAFGITASNGTLIGGTLTSGYIPKATGANSLGNSLIYDNGNSVRLGTVTGVGNELLLVSMDGTTNNQAINIKDRNASATTSDFIVFRKSDDTFLGSIRRNGTGNSLYIGGNDDLALGTGNIERLRISSTGNVGIGTTSPTRALDVNGSIALSFNGETQIVNDQRGTDSISIRGASNVNFHTFNGSSMVERMRVTSSGNFGIGTTNPIAKLDIDASSSNIAYFRSNYSGNAQQLLMSTAGSGITLQSQGYLSTTSSSLLLNPAGGNVGIGTTSPDQKLTVKGIAAIGQYTDGTAVINAYGATAYFGCNSPENGMSIYQTGAATFASTVTATGFFNSSDARLKNIISRDGDVAHFTWKDGRDTKTNIGYIAQEIQQVYPDAVQEDDKGMLSVNYIEVLVAKIQALENRLKKLENGI